MKIINRKKDYDYFAAFCNVGKIAFESSEYLNRCLKTFDVAKINVYAEEMHRFENDADAQKHELCNRLAHEFMPPIEREDISLLASRMDDVVDSVEEVMRRLYMCNIRSIRADAIVFSRLMVEVCSSFNQLLSEFPNFKKSKTVQNYIIGINTLENKGDRLHAESIRNLHVENVPAEQLIGWTMIFEAMEQSVDACESVADIIESIITKNT